VTIDMSVIMKKEGLVKLITRILLNRELCGYEVYREILAKGVQIRPNYLYMILTEMRSMGLLRARWVESKEEEEEGEQRVGGPRRHLYSLDEKGREEFRRMVRESLTVMMDAYVHANLNARDWPDHASAIKSIYSSFGIPPPGKGDKVVFATPSFDPLVCLPLGFRLYSEIFPDSSIVVVKPPGLRFFDDRPNITYVDGQRYDMPLKDGYADYLILEGFPREVTEKKTLLECSRVLKDDSGYLTIRFPMISTEEHKPKWGNFAEFVMKQYYDTVEQDRKTSRERVNALISQYFARHMEAEIRGIVVILASGKRGNAIARSREVTPIREIDDGSARPISVRSRSRLRKKRTTGVLPCGTDAAWARQFA
jgi:DNA-binding PadR family transcriptional regulator